MPFIDVRIFEERLDSLTEQRLISELTDAVTRVFDESARAHTWVVLTGIPAYRWGVGGNLGKHPARHDEVAADQSSVDHALRKT